MKNERHIERKSRTQSVFAQLKPKYEVRICEFDPTAIAVSGITNEQHAKLCKELRCSGTYNEKTRIGIITNFQEYK